MTHRRALAGLTVLLAALVPRVVSTAASASALDLLTDAPAQIDGVAAGDFAGGTVGGG